jgi:hypothetical protein
VKNAYSHPVNDLMIAALKSIDEDGPFTAGGGATAVTKALQERHEREIELDGSPWKVRSRYAISMTIVEAGGNRRDHLSIKSRIDLVLIERPGTAMYWGLWIIDDRLSGTILTQGQIDSNGSPAHRRAQAIRASSDWLESIAKQIQAMDSTAPQTSAPTPTETK